MRTGSLLIDLDGTLTDSREGIVASLRHALLRMDAPVPPDDQLADWIGTPLPAVFAALLRVSDDDARVAQAIAYYRERFDARGWRENRVYPAVPALLDEARAAGWHCVVATSKPQLFADRILAHFQLLERLDGVHGSTLDGRRTDKAELLSHVLRVERIDAARAVMLGDRHHDVAGARAHRIPCLGVLWGYGSRDELVRAGAAALCDQPDDVLDAAASLLAGAPRADS